MKKADGYLLVEKELIDGYESEEGNINNTHIVDCKKKIDGTW